MSIIVPNGKTLTKNDKKTENGKGNLKAQVLCMYVGLDLGESVHAEIQRIYRLNSTGRKQPDTVRDIGKGRPLLDDGHGRRGNIHISAQVFGTHCENKIAAPEGTGNHMPVDSVTFKL